LNYIKSSITIILFFLYSCNYTVKEKTCGQFKKGNFVFHFRGQDYQTDFLIDRADSLQIEVDKKSGKTSKLAIKWTGECNYEMKLLETTFDFPDSIQQLRKSKPLKTQILNWTKDYYVFQSKRDNSNFILTDTLWVVNK